MSLTAAAAIPCPNPGVRFAKAFPRFDELGAAGQRLWLYLWEKTAFGTRPVRLTDAEIAQACGRGIRWVQKALAQLLDLEQDGEPTPAIDRFRQYGPRHIAGRVIQIIVDFARPAETPPPTTTTTRPRPRPRPAATTRPDAPPPAIAATPPPPAEPRPTPEQARQAAQFFRAEIARIKAQADDQRAQQTAGDDRPTPPSKPIKGVDPHDPRYLEVKERLGALTDAERARLDAARANRGP